MYTEQHTYASKGSCWYFSPGQGRLCVLVRNSHREYKMFFPGHVHARWSGQCSVLDMFN